MPGLREFLYPEEYERRRRAMEPPELSSPQPQAPTTLQQLIQQGSELTAGEYTRQTSKAPVPPKEPDLTEWFLNGLIERATQKGEPPAAQLFEEKFRKSVSPAREFLANVLFGASAGASGQPYRSLKERRWKEFEEQNKQIEQAKLREQNERVNTMNMISEMLRARQQAQTQEIVAGLRANTQEQANQIALLRANIEAEKAGIDIKKYLKDYEIKVWNAQDTGDNLFDAARRMVVAKLQNAGVDLTVPAGQNRLWQETEQQWRKLLEVESQFNPKGARGAGGIYVMPVTGPDGNQYAALIDRNAPPNQALKGGVFVGRNVPKDAIESSNLMHNAASAVRTALTISQNNPEAVGHWEQMVPVTFRAAIGTLGSPERRVRLFFNKAISDYVLSISGKAVTDRERQFIMQGLPKYFERPGVFFPSAYSFAILLDSAALRTQYGINMDMTKAMELYMKAMQDHFDKYKTMKGFEMLDAERFLEMAAQVNGKKLRRAAFGNLEVVE